MPGKLSARMKWSAAFVLAIPPGMEDIYNPAKDAALTALIRAKWITSSFGELKGATTGTAYKLSWYCFDSKQYLSIEKIKESAAK